MNLEHFNSTLRLKNLWRVLTVDGIWSRVIKVKYIKKMSVAEWLRKGEYLTTNTSIIWNGFLGIVCWIIKSICWRVGHGEKI